MLPRTAVRLGSARLACSGVGFAVRSVGLGSA